MLQVNSPEEEEYNSSGDTAVAPLSAPPPPASDSIVSNPSDVSAEHDVDMTYASTLAKRMATDEGEPSHHAHHLHHRPFHLHHPSGILGQTKPGLFKHFALDPSHFDKCYDL